MATHEINNSAEIREGETYILWAIGTRLDGYILSRVIDEIAIGPVPFHLRQRLLGLAEEKPKQAPSYVKVAQRVKVQTIDIRVICAEASEFYSRKRIFRDSHC